MLRIVVHNERGYQGHAHVRPLTVLVIMSTQIMRGDWCSIYATLRKKKGTGKNETQEGSRDGEGGGGVCTRSSRWIQNELPSKTTVLNLSTIIGNDVEGFSPRWRAMEKKKKNDREMTKGESRTMEGRKRMFSLELLNCKFRIVEIHYRL